MLDEIASLKSQAGFSEPHEWVLNGELLTIGRWPDNDIVLAHRDVAQHHASVHRSSDGFVIEDLGSEAGTFVNGERVQSLCALHDGDLIYIPPHFELRFHIKKPTIKSGRLIGVHIDSEAHEVYVNGQRVDPPLSTAQYTLLLLLLRRAGEIVEREEIVSMIWPPHEADHVSDQAIDALVRRLRERLAEIDPDHQYILTIRGHGFRFENRE